MSVKANVSKNQTPDQRVSSGCLPKGPTSHFSPGKQDPVLARWVCPTHLLSSRSSLSSQFTSPEDCQHLFGTLEKVHHAQEVVYIDHILRFLYKYTYVCMFSHVRFFVTVQSVAHQALLSTRFSSQEYWSGLPFPIPGDPPDPGIKSASLASPALADGFFFLPLHHLGRPFIQVVLY